APAVAIVLPLRRMLIRYAASFAIGVQVPRIRTATDVNRTDFQCGNGKNGPLTLAGPSLGSSTTNEGNSSRDLNQNVRAHFPPVVRSGSVIRHRCVVLDSSVIELEM